MSLSTTDLKEYLLCLKSDLCHAIAKHHHQGYDAAVYLSHSMDIIIGKIADNHLSDEDKKQIVMIAIGGYGRGTLAPFSDIDILFLLDNDTNADLKSKIQNILYDLWDLKLTLGYCVHALGDITDKIVHDMNFCTALLERRMIYGDNSLYNRLNKTYTEYQNISALTFLSAKMIEREQRHLKSGDSRYLVEPDIKNSKGGLRDLHSLYWIGKYLYVENDLNHLIKHNIFTAADLRTIRTAERFLWTVRFMLHDFHKKQHDKLDFDSQSHIADLLGYKDKSGRLSVENFMKHYFIVVRNVGHLTRIFCYALEIQHRMRIKNLQTTLKDYQMYQKHYDIHDGRINFLSRDMVKNHPILMIEIFEIADKHNILLHPSALVTIRQYAHKINHDFIENTNDAFGIFRRILCSGLRVEKTLRDMNEAGILGRLIPDFGRIVALMQFNMYHHYTVDEHLIRTVGVIHNIANGDFTQEHPLASQIIHRLEMRDVLFVAVFLHDIAKGRPEDHSIVGAEIALWLGKKMGFSDAEIEILQWLVLHHLSMSDISQKRDLSDNQVIEEFAKFVKSSQRLKLLLCLTVADIRAVGPGVWNGWKGELLRTLYNHTQDMLQGGYIKETRSQRCEMQKKIFFESAPQSLFINMSDEDTHKIINDLPIHFWLSTPLKTQIDIISVMVSCHHNPSECMVKLIPDVFCDVTEVIIYTKDYSGLFTTVTGAMSASGTYIYDAKIYTSISGWAIDHFRIQDTHSKSITDESYLQRISDNIQKAVKNHKIDFSQDKTSNLKHIKQSKDIFHVPSLVVFDNTGSSNNTIIEIETQNRYFLLYDIAHLLHECNISIISAHINSYGEKAIDVFYIRDKFGFKIEDKKMIESLKQKILSCLNNPA